MWWKKSNYIFGNLRKFRPRKVFLIQYLKLWRRSFIVLKILRYFCVSKFRVFLSRFLMEWHPMALRCMSLLGKKICGPVSPLRQKPYTKDGTNMFYDFFCQTNYLSKCLVQYIILYCITVYCIQYIQYIQYTVYYIYKKGPTIVLLLTPKVRTHAACPKWQHIIIFFRQ